MRRLIVILFFILGLSSTNFGQDSKWSLGLGVSPQWDGVSTSIYINRNIGDHWQFGLMPIYRYYEYSTSQRDFYGVNLNSRFLILPETKLQPYLYGFSGYLSSSFRGENSSSTRTDNINFSLGAGTTFKIGQSKWSLDANIGYLWFRGINGSIEKFRSPFYSFGVFRKF